MKLLLSSLLLSSLCALSSWSVSSTLVVTHSPDVSVMEGETVTITCCGTLEFGRITFNWLKNQTDIDTEIFIMKNHSKGDSLQQETSHCSNLTFTNVTRENSGRYICRVTVEVPLLKTVEGNGTVITVTARDNTTDSTAEDSHSKDVLIFVLRCLPIVALVVTFFSINYLAKKAQQRAQAPGRTEENQEEEEEDETEI
ncbi:uncharacterized protein LOC119481296 isoform X5 [Sebastes umbrosus]|uniref:uncharacterized protein LOC119481296 isoform X5 n=1 Tax=Sebastes umbrosus TaxID=72105 RepID=UPI00189EC1AD|nr:uncharacterized protein LOC119481296 isoform X5 [Sebastes umbrosus]